MKKAEKLKNFLKKMESKKIASVKEILADLNDSNSEAEVNPDKILPTEENVLNKAPQSQEEASSHFHFDHPEHGQIEVHAKIPKNASSHKDIQIHSIGAPNDQHISPDEAGLHPEHIEAMKHKAFKLGPNPQEGTHFGKSEKEYTAKEISLIALKNAYSKYEKNLKKAESKEMKRERGPEDTGSPYNEEQEVGNPLEMADLERRDRAKAVGKYVKELKEKLEKRRKKNK